jgi:hypothetical protein
MHRQPLTRVERDRDKHKNAQINQRLIRRLESARSVYAVPDQKCLRRLPKSLRPHRLQIPRDLQAMQRISVKDFSVRPMVFL